MPDSSGRPLTTVFRFRLSEPEREALNANARELGVAPSVYARLVTTIPVRVIGVEEAALSDRATSAKTLLVYDRASIPQLLMQLRRWGHHYNQAVKALNTIAKKEFMRPEDTESVCRDAVRAIDKVAEAREMIEGRIDALEDAWAVKLSGEIAR